MTIDPTIMTAIAIAAALAGYAICLRGNRKDAERLRLETAAAMKKAHQEKERADGAEWQLNSLTRYDDIRIKRFGPHRHTYRMDAHLAGKERSAGRIASAWVESPRKAIAICEGMTRRKERT